MGSTSGDQKQTLGVELALAQDTPFSVLTRLEPGYEPQLRSRVGEL